MDVIQACMDAADHHVPLSIELAEELLNLESQLAMARRAACRHCPTLNVKLSVQGENERNFHLNSFEVAKLKMGIDHQQWRTDNPVR